LNISEVENTESYKNLPPFVILEIDGIDIAVFKVDFEESKKFYKKSLIIKNIEYNYLTDKRPTDMKLFDAHIAAAIKQILIEMHNNNGRANFK